MKTFAMPILAAAGLALSTAASHAQSVGVEIYTDGPSYGYSTYGAYGSDYYGYRPGYSANYGYRSSAPAGRNNYTGYRYRADTPVAGTGVGCGTYFYWDVDRCVDARNK